MDDASYALSLEIGGGLAFSFSPPLTKHREETREVRSYFANVLRSWPTLYISDESPWQVALLLRLSGWT